MTVDWKGFGKSNRSQKSWALKVKGWQLEFKFKTQKFYNILVKLGIIRQLKIFLSKVVKVTNNT